MVAIAEATTRPAMRFFTPEARPRRSSGTRSGMNPCAGPWATPSGQPQGGQEDEVEEGADQDVGRRRPQRKVGRSLMAPAMGWTTMARIRPRKVRPPR